MSQVHRKAVACLKCCCSQDLPVGLQQCDCTCHPANWPLETVAAMRRALYYSHLLLGRALGQLMAVEKITAYRMGSVLNEDFESTFAVNREILDRTTDRLTAVPVPTKACLECIGTGTIQLSPAHPINKCTRCGGKGRV